MTAMIGRLILTGAVRGPYRKPSLLRRLLARLEPVPEDRPVVVECWAGGYIALWEPRR